MFRWICFIISFQWYGSRNLRSLGQLNLKRLVVETFTSPTTKLNVRPRCEHWIICNKSFMPFWLLEVRTDFETWYLQIVDIRTKIVSLFQDQMENLSFSGNLFCIYFALFCNQFFVLTLQMTIFRTKIWKFYIRGVSIIKQKWSGGGKSRALICMKNLL